MRANLSATTIGKLRPKGSTYEVRDRRLKGFLLRVHPSGRMTYLAEYARGRKYTIGTTDKLKPAEARDMAWDVLNSAKKGQDPAAKRKAEKAETLGQYLDNVYEPWALSHLKTGAVQVKRIRSRFADLLKRKPHEITPWLIEKYRSKRLKEVSVRTVNRDVQALRAALRRAFDWGILDHHPLARVKSLKEDSSARVRYLTPAEEARLRDALDAREEKMRQGRDNHNLWRRERGYRPLPDLRAVAYTDRLAPLVLIALNTGCRRGELFSLKWSDVDLQKATLTVEGSTAKTHTTRHVPLNSEALDILQSWKAQSHGDGLAFPGDGGRRLDNINTAWENLMKAAAINGFRFHDLRHTFASKLVMVGVDLATVRELLGHSDIKMTLRYAHLAPERKAEAVEKIVSRKATVEAVSREG